MGKDLTLVQEKRQETVDDAIDTMLTSISLRAEWQWDIEKAGAIRDFVYETVFKSSISEMEFYPYIET